MDLPSIDIEPKRFKKRLHAKSYTIQVPNVLGVTKVPIVVKGKRTQRSQVPCPVCDKSYESSCFRRHLRSHKLEPAHINRIVSSAYNFKDDKPFVEKRLCPFCDKLLSRLDRHITKFHLNNEDDDDQIVPDAPDALDAPNVPDYIQERMLHRIRDDHGVDVGNIRSIRKTKYYLDPAGMERQNKIVEAIQQYYTNPHSLNMNEGRGLNQIRTNIRRLHTMVSGLLGRTATAEEVFDSNIFILFRADDISHQANTRSTMCSQFIVYLKAIIWVKTKMTDSPAARVFDLISLDRLNTSIDEVKDAKNRAERVARSMQPLKNLKKSMRLPTLYDLKKIYLKTTELLSHTRPVDENEFVELRNHLMLSTLMFCPVRLMPYESLTVEEATAPFAVKDRVIWIQVTKGQHLGIHKRVAQYGPAFIILSVEMYKKLVDFIEILKEIPYFKKFPKKFYGAHVFCQWASGKPLKTISSTIKNTSKTICGKEMTSNLYRMTMTTEGRKGGMDAKLLARALLHNDQTSDKYETVLNKAPADWFHLVVNSQEMPRQEETEEEMAEEEMTEEEMAEEEMAEEEMAEEENSIVSDSQESGDEIEPLAMRCTPSRSAKNYALSNINSKKF